MLSLADPASTVGSASWGRSTESNSTFSRGNDIQIHIPPDGPGAIIAEFQDVIGSVTKTGLFGKKLPVGKEDEEGILLQPDFEFDENGNIVEFHSSRMSPRKRRKIASIPPFTEDIPGRAHQDNEVSKLLQILRRGTQTEVLTEKGMHMQQDDDVIRDDVMMNLDPNAEKSAADNQANNCAPHQEEGKTLDPTEIYRAPSRKRTIREVIFDERTTLRNTDLYRSNEDYLINMARANKQKHHNKLPTIIKKNAAFWVYGQGLGSVGRGLGTSREPYPLPLNMLCGETLYELVTGIRLGSDSDKGSAEVQEQARGEINGAHEKDPNMPQDVEFARHAPPSLNDDASQMPWNISASLHSSGHTQRYGSRSMSIGDLRFDSSSRAGVGGGSGNGVAGRYRITSSSPLAGRGYLDPKQFDDGIGIGGTYTDDEFEITRYLENELASDRENLSNLSHRRSRSRGLKLDSPERQNFQRDLASLDQESLNFYEFIRENMSAPTSASPSVLAGEDQLPGSVAFSAILSPSQTSRIIATQAFMNVLTLATEGWLIVRQDRGRISDGGRSGRNARMGFRSGDIFMRVVEESNG